MPGKVFTFVTATAFVMVILLQCTGQFVSPEATLERYMNAVRAGDKETILTCFHPVMSDFHLSESISIGSYAIKKKTIFDKSHVDEWNSLGIVPPAEVGDVELEVEENIDGQLMMFSYWFRRVDSGWKIISYTSWGDY